MVVEIVVYIWEDTRHDVFHAHCLEIECRSGYWNEYEHYVVKEESRYDDERCPFKLIVPEQEIVYDDKHYHGIVGGISHVEKLARHGSRQQFRE